MELLDSEDTRGSNRRPAEGDGSCWGLAYGGNSSLMCNLDLRLHNLVSIRDGTNVIENAMQKKKKKALQVLQLLTSACL